MAKTLVGRRVGWYGKPVRGIPGVAVREYENETAFQIYCAQWLRKQYELTGDESYRWWHHSANEREGARAGFRAKMMGQAKGYPDFVSARLQLALELKVGNGTASDEQKAWLEHFMFLGWHSEVVRTFERFREIVLEAVKENKNG